MNHSIQHLRGEKHPHHETVRIIRHKPPSLVNVRHRLVVLGCHLLRSSADVKYLISVLVTPSSPPRVKHAMSTEISRLGTVFQISLKNRFPFLTHTRFHACRGLSLLCQ